MNTTTQDPWTITTLEQGIESAKSMVKFACDRGVPCAWELVRTKSGNGKFEVQPFGMHALFKSHKLLHVEPIPESHRGAL